MAQQSPVSAADTAPTLDPQVAALLAAAERLALPEVWDVPLSEARAGFLDIAAQRAGAGPQVQVAAVVGGELAGVPIRTYAPRALTVPTTVVYFHGGGWVLGDLDSHDVVARTLCDRLGATVVSVGYPLAPENAYPAALDACLDVLEALADRRPLAVAGDSAGGNLAAAVSLVSPFITAQLLLYPCLDVRQSSQSYQDNAEGYGLTARTMAWFWEQYGVSAQDQLASPLAAADLVGKPPAVIATAGFDPLRDEGEEFAERLAAAEVPVTALHYPTLTHSFFADGAQVAAAAAAIEEICATFRAVLLDAAPTGATA